MPTEITLEIQFQGISANYDARRFQALAAEKTSGNLQIPTFGVYKNMVFKDVFSINTDLKKIGVITATVILIEVTDAVAKPNWLAQLDNALNILDALIQNFLDATYFLTEIVNAVDSVKASINKSLTALSLPLIAINDLQNSLKLGEFLKTLDGKLSLLSSNFKKIFINDFNKKKLASTNNWQNNQYKPLNILNSTMYLKASVNLIKDLPNQKFISRENLDSEIDFLINLETEIITDNDLPQDIINEYLTINNLCISVLLELKENLPQVYTINVNNESSLLLAYRTSGNIENVDKIEEINNFKDLTDISGEVKCLKF
jgi:prophage DNA circulation protein